MPGVVAEEPPPTESTTNVSNDGQSKNLLITTDHEIAATKNLTLRFPWTVAASKKHSGRYYFYNLDTKEQKWSLPKDMFFLIAATTPNIFPPQQQIDDSTSLPPLVKKTSISIAPGDDSSTVSHTAPLTYEDSNSSSSSSSSISSIKATRPSRPSRAILVGSSSLSERTKSFKEQESSSLMGDDILEESSSSSLPPCMEDHERSESAAAAADADAENVASLDSYLQSANTRNAFGMLPSLNPFKKLWSGTQKTSRSLRHVPSSQSSSPSISPVTSPSCRLAAASSSTMMSFPTSKISSDVSGSSFTTSLSNASADEVWAFSSEKSLKHIEELERGNSTDDLEEDDNTADDVANDVADPVLSVVGGLGRGGYSVVVKVRNEVDQMQYAMKIVRKNTRSEKSIRKHREQIKFEHEVMSKVSSPFIQRCLYAFESPSSIFFVLDLNSGGDLFYHLVQRIQRNENGFKEKECQILLGELYLALEHLHSHSIIHRDIKVENIMLDGAGHVKLVDFGLSVLMESDVQEIGIAGSVLYMSPEIIKHRLGGRFSDWWAYGILAHELLTGNTPWSSLNDAKVIKWEIVNKPVLPPTSLSKNAAKFVGSLLCHDVQRRLGSKEDTEIKSSLFFKNLNWDSMKTLDHAPAFVPDVVNVTQEDQDEAMELYYEIINSDKQEVENQWMLGLPSIEGALQS